MTAQLKASLEAQGDESDPYRDRLRVSLADFRERVGQLVSFIPRDMPGYTVHDLTHLDALWEMAHVIAGDDYELNPAEAYVLGGAILLHDAGMTVAAYVKNRQEIESKPEFRAAYNSAKSQLSESRIPPAQLDARARELAIAEVLRLLHPKKAEELATQAWRCPRDGTDIFLIQDDGLREHYGDLIGRVAHSHHWDHKVLQEEFCVQLGSAPAFPPEWQVDPLKIALILRCADASHLDARRAPRLLFALGRVAGASREHWIFQGKLSKPVVREGKLQYASTSDFNVDESEAWQLSFDTLRMVDKELRSAAEINIQRKFPSFKVDGVLGAGSPGELSRYIRVRGWRPLALNLQVSNVPHLARTLGGKDLYSSRFAPLRELIQNAADSIEARSAIDPDFSIGDGRIIVCVTTEDDTTIVDVLDNGVGMSERVLTGPLLDFGFSFWRSSLARQEFPGIPGEGLAPRGRYGIGFFSVFMWADSVEVSSRVYSSSIDDAAVLQFKEGLDARPLLREATAEDRSSSWHTRVRLTLKKDKVESIFKVDPERLRYLRYREWFPSVGAWGDAVKLLAATLPIHLEARVSAGSVSASLPKWAECSDETFKTFFHDLLRPSAKYARFAEASTRLTKNDAVVGRGYLIPDNDNESGGVLVYDRGIFAGTQRGGNVYGVLEGQVVDAARERFTSSRFSDSQVWLTDAARAAFSICTHKGEEIGVQRTLVGLDYLFNERAFFIFNREVISVDEFRSKLGGLSRVWFRLRERDSRDSFQMFKTDSIDAIYGLEVDPSRVYSLFSLEAELDEHSSIEQFAAGGESLLAAVFRVVLEEFGESAVIRTTRTVRDRFEKDFLDVEFVRTEKS